MDDGPPAHPPAIRMTWANLLFLHWPVNLDALRPLVPPQLDLDAFDGSAWVALVPFRMENCSFRGFSWVPRAAGLADFFECNVRTYVSLRLPDGSRVSGVWFFSLDAESFLPVWGARLLWSLNYTHSRFDVRRDGDVTRYSLARRAGPWPKARTSVAWRTGAPLPPSRPGSFEHFATERYRLFSLRRGRIMAGRIDHIPWPLHAAEVLHLDDGLLAAAGLRTQGPPIALASPRIDVLGWSLERT